MSSDPFRDLARSSDAFAAEFRAAVTRNQQPGSASPAAREFASEPFAGEWGASPSRETFRITWLLAASCTDHLLGLAAVLSAGPVFSLSTVARGAMEAAALGCYLTERDIDARERLRRTMNYHLAGMSENIWLLKNIAGSEAARKVACETARIDKIARSARRHGFDFHTADGRGRSPYIGSDRPPSAMKMISDAIDAQTPRLGMTWQRILSATAHSQVHGLTRMLAQVGPGSSNGEAVAAVNRDPRTLAIELFGAPFTGVCLLKGMEWFSGCDMATVHKPANEMFQTWTRIAGIPAPQVIL